MDTETAMAKLPAPRYEFDEVEGRWIKNWQEAAAFRPEYALSKQNRSAHNAQSFCIVIPPPNVTGELHVGHALNQTIQDLLIRTARKRGRNTLWVPGMDHAGIATQVRVEQELKKQNLDRFQLGRQKFIEKIWQYKEQYGGRIAEQQKLMGFSLDLSRERFTMDAELSHAVRQVFIQLYQEGLIYRDKRIVNWDPQSHTVLSELEVEHDENYQGELYDFAYPLFEQEGEIVVTTTRPETMLGDTAIAVHPQDKRYHHLIGSFVLHPFLDRKIKIIADAILVDPKFGTGAVKLTPAHDPNDFEAGKRHNLDMINIFDENACINEQGGSFAGMDRYIARKEVKKELTHLGLERGSRPHTMSVGRSQRSGVVVEPIVSTQWFVKMEPLAKKAKEAVKSGKIQFVPQQWENTYFHWMDEIRDWCISRQLWWGHQIPAWYGPDGKVFVGQDEAEAQTQAQKYYKKKSVILHQDKDVLDTWFSSALWPFSTLGWPKQTKDLATYYPTTVLVTGFDIIFFWVARMIMMGLHFVKQPPFHKICIHGLMRDEHGQKMSKTKGNVIDPLQAIKQHGTDAFRFFLMATLSEGKDSCYSQQRLRGYQNFTNKIWNSSRFVLMNLPADFRLKSDELLDFALEAEDYWILNRLNQTINDVTQALDDYKFHLGAEYIYAFFWHEFCDWYIELTKARIFAQNKDDNFDTIQATRQVLCFVLKNALGLLHPFMPFITEEIYSFFAFAFSSTKADPEFLTVSPWPETLHLPSKAKAPSQALALLQEAIRATRLIRAQTKIPPDKKIQIIIRSKDKQIKKILDEKDTAIRRLAGAISVTFQENYQPNSNDVSEAFSNGEVYVALDSVSDGFDVTKEKTRITNELAKMKKQMDTCQAKLANDNFIKNAPTVIVKKEQEKLKSFADKESILQKSLLRLDTKT